MRSEILSFIIRTISHRTISHGIDMAILLIIIPANLLIKSMKGLKKGLLSYLRGIYSEGAAY